MPTFRELGLSIGKLKTGPLNHILDVSSDLGVSHRTYINNSSQVCTGFTVISPGLPLYRRFAAATHSLNGAGELTSAHQISEWGYLETPIVLTNTPSVGLAYEYVSQWMMKKIPDIGNDTSVVIPVVGECDDSLLNDVKKRPWGEKEMFEALDEALAAKRSPDALAQGSVGAGTGTINFELKGGIGSSSREVEVAGHKYTVGVMLQTNYGWRDQFTFLGKPLGKLIQKPKAKSIREGSCIGILATDAPLSPHTLRRLAVRMGLGLARTGSHAHHASGEIMMAFSTARETVFDLKHDGDYYAPFFWAAIEATEEAVYNALLCSRPIENARATVPALDAKDLILEE